MTPTLAPIKISSFVDRFYRECVERSGIDPDLYAEATGIVEDTGYWEPNLALGQHVSKFWQTKPPHSYGAIAGFYQETGELWQAKAENPRPDKKGSPAKYECIIGAPLRGFLPAVNRETRRKIAKRYGCEMPPAGQAFWDWVEQHPEIPIVITEGGKKSLSLLSQGYVAIALIGVNGGVLKNETIGGVKIRRIKSELIPDLARFAVEGREFTLAFDQDVKAHTRHRVECGLNDLAFHLEQAGASVRIAAWDGQGGRCKGVDDLIVNEGVAAWQEAYESATIAPVWRIKRDLARRVKRKPDLHLGDRPFIEAIDRIPESGIIGLYGPKGSEKSTLIKLILQSQAKPWLSLTFLQSLARDQAAGWGGVFINEGDRYGEQLLDSRGVPVLGGSGCYPSFLGLAAVKVKILILDETTPGLNFLHTSSLANQNGIRPLLEAELIRRIQEADLVILADADLTEEAIGYVEVIRGERAFLVRSDRKPLGYAVTLLDGSRDQAIADFHNAALNVPDGKLLMFHSDSKALVDSLADDLEKQGIKTLRIHQETSGGEIERGFLKSKGSDSPLLVRQGIKVILCSPSVTQGFSIQNHTDLIHEVWGIFKGCSISAEAIAQALDRTRSLAPRTVWLPLRGNAISKLSTGTSAQAVLKDLETSSKASLRLARLSLRPDSLATAESIDYGRENLKLVAFFEAHRNRGMMALRHTVWALLEYEGKQVSFTPCQSTKADAAALSEALQEARRQHEIERAARIAAGIPLTQEQVDELEKRRKKEPETVTQKELEELERFYISQFYRANDVDTDLVLWDKGGQKRKQIRRLETVLNPEQAIATTAASIDRNANTPQDWDKSAVRSWLLQQTGAAEFIQRCWDSSITQMDAATIAPIAKALQQHPEEFRIAFGMRNIQKLSPMQVIAWVLDWCGITRTSEKQRRGKDLVWVYYVEPENLARLKAVVERRLQDVPPPLVNEENQGGGTLPIHDQTEDLAAFRYWWESTTDPKEREAIIQEAIALNLPPNPDLWRAAS